MTSLSSAPAYRLLGPCKGAVEAGFAAALLFSGTAVDAGTATGALTAQIAAPATAPGSTLSVSDAGGAGETSYPLQFGRPFLEGAIPSGRCPVMTWTPSGGSPVALSSQADVKNRYPDGSVEFAVMATLTPAIPANGSGVIAFSPGICSNTPLTSAQMLDPSYNFDAAMTLTAAPLPPSITGAPVSAANQALYSGANGGSFPSITNGGFTITVNGAPVVVTGISFLNCNGNCSAVINAAIAAAIPGARFASGVSWVGEFVGPPASTIGYASAPPTGQDLSAFYNWTSASAAKFSPSGSPAVNATADARTMLQNGDYKLWTSGPVAQTIILADDSPARKYDIGFGDGYHPFRPRYYATFWPATHQVFVRSVGENGNTTELEDLAYSLTLTGGRCREALQQGQSEARLGDDRAGLRASGSAARRSPKSTSTTISPISKSPGSCRTTTPRSRWSPATVASEYAAYCTNAPHDIYDASLGRRRLDQRHGHHRGAPGHRADPDLERDVALHRRLADAAIGARHGRSRRCLAGQSPRGRPVEAAEPGRPGAGRTGHRQRLWPPGLDHRSQDARRLQRRRGAISSTTPAARAPRPPTSSRSSARSMSASRGNSTPRTSRARSSFPMC